MRWLFVVLNCEAVTFPLEQIIDEEKALQSKSDAKCVQENETRITKAYQIQ